jgi:hypothetical protein
MANAVEQLWVGPQLMLRTSLWVNWPPLAVRVPFQKS